MASSSLVKICYAGYESLTEADQKVLFNSYTKGKTNDETSDVKFRMEIMPRTIPGVYCRIAFPFSVNVAKMSLTVNNDNILNGSLSLHNRKTNQNLYLLWWGYASQLYDGQLYLAVVDPNAKITGEVNGTKVEFIGDKPQQQAWPGFLVIYS